MGYDEIQEARAEVEDAKNTLAEAKARLKALLDEMGGDED